MAKLVSSAAANELYISKTGTETPPYNSPETGFRTIQKAIKNSISGDVIMITPDIYYERVIVNPTETMASSLTLKGDGFFGTIIDAEKLGSCIQISDFADALILEDLVLRNGISEFGGGIHSQNSTVSLERVRISHCHAGRGGGIYARNSTVRIENSIISYCSAKFDLGQNGGKGGGIYFLFNPFMEPSRISDSVFYGNKAYFGGAMRFWDASATIERCHFFDNRAEDRVIDVTEISRVDFEDNLFYHNQSLLEEVLGYSLDSRGDFCFSTFTENTCLSNRNCIATDLFSEISLSNSAFQRNVADGLDLNPLTIISGSVFSTPPAGFNEIQAKSSEFSQGKDGEFYLASSPEFPSIFIGAGVSEGPCSVDDTNRKCFVSGPSVASPPNAGYGYPLGSEGILEISTAPLLKLKAKGVPYLNYALEQSEAIDFGKNLQISEIGPLGNEAIAIHGKEASPSTQFYRLRGKAPVGNKISVHVTNSESQNLKGITIDVIEQSTLNWMASGMTDIGGNATITNISPGNYTLVAGVGSLDFIPLFLGNQYSIELASFFKLDSNNPTFSTSFSLNSGARIMGSVRDSNSSPIANVFITIFDNNEKAIKFSTTNEFGKYSIGGLLAGDYKVLADKTPQYKNSFWNNKDSIIDATPIPVSGSEIVDANFDLDAFAKLSGKVTIPLGGNMFQILIVLYDNTTSEEIDFIYSDNFGSYILHAPAGEYFVSVGEGSPYVVYYSDPVVMDPMKPVENFNVTLDFGGTISGVLLTTSGIPIIDLYVDFYSQESGEFKYVDSTTSDILGSYFSPNLAPGTYFVNVPGETIFHEFITNDRWYDNKDKAGEANRILLIQSDEIDHINFSLEPIP